MSEKSTPSPDEERAAIRASIAAAAGLSPTDRLGVLAEAERRLTALRHPMDRALSAEIAAARATIKIAFVADAIRIAGGLLRGMAGKPPTPAAVCPPGRGTSVGDDG